MAYDRETLRRIYSRTEGKCHICHKKLSLQNYGEPNGRAAWEVEHSVARANGGTDHLNNLFPACIPCNRTKGTFAARTARSWHGHTKAPLSKERRAQIRKKNAVGSAVLGGLVGLAINPAAALWGAGIGALIGHSTNPEG
jgi:hypothetical protein